jgi:DNA-binding NarL/FixJ family response regulator
VGRGHDGCKWLAQVRHAARRWLCVPLRNGTAIMKTFQPIRVIIADDHPIVREGLDAILGSDRQVHIVGVATNFAEVLALLGAVQAHVLVLDLGGMAGAPLTLVARVRREYPHVAIVVFSSSVDLAPELLQAGVCGYVVKEELSAQLLTAIHAARAHQRFLSSVVEEYVIQTTNGRRQHHLAPKELNVLKLLAQGLGTSAIAEQLAIDPRSVQNYITTLRRKIGCEERIQLVDWYKRMYGGEAA